MPARAAVLAASVLTLTVGAAGGAYAFDATRGARIAEGVTVGGVDVGGMAPEEARRALEARYVAAIEQPIVVHHDRSTWTLGAREAKVEANVDAMVDEAVARSDEGGVLRRSWRRLTGGELDGADLQPQVTYSKAAVVRLLDHVRRGVERPAKDATLRFTAAGPREVDGRRGLEVKASELHRDIRAAIVSPTLDRRFIAQTRKVQPKVTRAKLAKRYPVALVADRSAYELKVYKNFKLVRTYGIAVGAAGLETPAGEYEIANKAVNPAWHVPDSDWAGDLAGQVIPGGAPNNPIIARWLGIADGVGIHGTSARGSIGTNASHGCIRMLPEDVIDLYPQVPVGAPIYIA